MVPESLLSEFTNGLEAAGCERRRGASPEVVREFERRYSVALPQDMRAFYQYSDGMGSSDWAFDSDMRVLPLVELHPVPLDDPSYQRLPNPAATFIIVDNSLSAYFFAIDLAAADRPSYLLLDAPVRVATGFTDLLRKVVHDSRALWDGELAG
jgi:hypothetical protein